MANEKDKKNWLDRIAGHLPESMFEAPEEKNPDDGGATAPQNGPTRGFDNVPDPSPEEKDIETHVKELNGVIFGMKDSGNILEFFMDTLKILTDEDRTPELADYAKTIKIVCNSNPGVTVEILLDYFAQAKSKVQSSSEDFSSQCDEQIQSLEQKREQEKSRYRDLIAQKKQNINELEEQLKRSESELASQEAALQGCDASFEPKINAAKKNKASGVEAASRIRDSIDQHMQMINSAKGDTKKD